MRCGFLVRIFMKYLVRLDFSLNGSALHQGLAPLMNDLQGVVDSHDLSDEILLIAEKVG